VAGRDELVGEVVWYLTRRELATAFAAAEGLTGYDRVMATVAGFMREVVQRTAVRHLLETEPEFGLRIVTSKHGPVQAGVVDAIDRLLAEEERAGALQLGIDRGTAAYAIVRIGESFLYSDVIADNEPDVEQGIAVIGRLLR
jgi:Tetracyclin repressor-like, C-terminal domain